jgi:hypothetical protein
MIDLYKQTLVNQFHAALSTLNECVSRCPRKNWETNVGNFPLWHVAYHALYYADLYLSPNEESFTPPGFHQQNYQFFGRLPWPPHESVTADEPYDKKTILHYIDHCRHKAMQRVTAETSETLHGPCGFSWYKIPRAEFHLNNVRHIHHHAAQISLQLRNTAGIEIPWVGSGFKTSREIV